MKIQNILTSELAQAALKDTVSMVAPRVSRVLGEKGGGPITEAAVRAVSRELLGTEDPAPGALETRLANLSPEDQVALAKANAQLEADLAKVGMQDRADARAHARETGDLTPTILAGAAFAALVGICAALLFLPAPIEGTERDLLFMVAGTLMALVKQGFDFFLGSTRESGRKTGLLAGVKR